MKALKTGMELIADERQRQLRDEGYNSDHDDEHDKGEITMAAHCYELPNKLRESYSSGVFKLNTPRLWPWDKKLWKPTINDRQRELVKAGALYLAEKDRIERKIKNIAFKIDSLNKFK